MLACFCGCGIQVASMSFFVLTTICLMTQDTSWRPFFFNFYAVFMAIGGCTNGYVTAKYLKFFGTTDLFFTILVCAVALPLYIITALMIESIFSWYGELPARHNFG